MKLWVKLSIYFLTAALFTFGFIAIFLRGTTPHTYGWNIAHESHEGYYLRIESGEITESYLNRDIMIITLRQHVDVYIGGALVLSSRASGQPNPIPLIYRIRVNAELIGKDMSIVLTTPYPRENLLMGNALSFNLVNPGIIAVDYSIVAICIVAGIAAIVIAFMFGIRNAWGILIYALINFSFAANIALENITDPRILYIANRASYHFYMIPMLVFFLLATKGVWRKYAIILAVLPVIYTIAAFALHIARIIPFGLTDGGYNYVVASSFAALILILAIQPSDKNRYSVIAQIQLALWMLWSLTIAARLLVFDMNVFVNVEYRIMYGIALLYLTFYGVSMYAKRIKDLQLSESIMSLRVENLMLNFEQTNEYIHKVNSLKHDMKNHLVALRILMKDKKYDNAQNYLEKYVGEINEIAEAAYHSNYLINAVVHDLIHRAKSLGVKVKLNLKASPVSISEPDIIGLLTNITDNALEACAKLPKEQEGFISLSVTRREPYFAVACENSNPGCITTGTANEEGREILTSKAKSGHGYGIKIIERIAASYDGMVEVSYNDEVFTITAILKDT